MKKFTLGSLLLLTVATTSAAEPAQEMPDSIFDENATLLDDIVVTARKKLITADAEKVSYEAQDDPDAQALSALDMLRRVPMVNVDGQDNISLNGKSDFQIYVDGKPNPMLSSNPGQLLKTIPASSIARFEVINNPGAKYDAEGIGGIINIVLKSTGNLDGYTATVTATGGNNMATGNIYAMMQQDKIAVTANVSAMHFQSPEAKSEINRTNTADNTQMLNSAHTNSQYNNFMASLNLDWKPNDANKFSFSGSFNRAPFRTYTNGEVLFSDLTTLNPISGYGMYSRNRTRSMGITAGADYAHYFNGNNMHKLELAYRLNVTPTRTWAENTFSLLDILPSSIIPDDYETSDRTSMTENIAQIDYNLPINDNHTIALGSKMTFRRSWSDALGMDYVHHSTIAAGYANYSLKAGDFALSAGARYEHTHQSARFEGTNREPYEANYDNFVPSLTMTYSFAGIRNLSAGYNMRISRPGIAMLNPYINTSNPLDVSVGNPNLRPEKYNNLTLSWSAMWGKVMFNAQAGYSFCNDGITAIKTMKDGITYSSYENTLRSRQANASVFVNYNPFLCTRININATAQYNNLRTPQGLANHGWTGNYMIGVQQMLPWNLNLSANVFGMTGMKNLQMSMDAMWTHMLSLTRSFASDRLNVSITAVSPFCAQNKIKIHEWGAGMDNHTTMKIDIRRVMVSVSYRFGDLKPRFSTPREIESDIATPTSTSSSIPGMNGNVPGM